MAWSTRAGSRREAFGCSRSHPMRSVRRGVLWFLYRTVALRSHWYFPRQWVSCQCVIHRSVSSWLPLRRTGRNAGSDGLTVFVLCRAPEVTVGRGSSVLRAAQAQSLVPGAGERFAGPRCLAAACGSLIRKCACDYFLIGSCKVPAPRAGRAR
mgnify:CR=1 FL=1